MWRYFSLLGLLLLGACAETQFIAQASKVFGGQQSPMPTPMDTPDYVATNPDGTPIPYKVGKPYSINGRTYAPKEDWTYAEEGMASWYGDDFHGRPTANGERFNKDALTAAHRTLPLPSLVKVTNLDNGRTAILRVNDRGPFSRGRIIDVSHQAARILGFEMEGTAQVRVELLRDESKKLAAAHGADIRERLALLQQQQDPIVQQQLPNASNASVSSEPLALPELAIATPPPSANGYFVQVGSFSRWENVERLQNQLKNLGQVRIDPLQTNGRKLYRVRVGPVLDRADAAQLQQQMDAIGLTDSRIITE